jgi:dienelactone hydrolase
VLTFFLFLLTFQFGADKVDLDYRTSSEQMAIYNSNSTLFVQRIQRAMDQLKMHSKDVSMDNVAIIGYCFGGSGVVQYGFSGATDTKVNVAFHGGLTSLPTVMEPISPYMQM